ncbi:MAG: hypothetical protein U1B80_06775 [Anaerolineaceae bacterium]|nr:hypothetical protein [Anaerolineaceae bacterium]
MNDLQRVIVQELAQSVVLQAIADLKSRKVEESLDAALWLAGDNFPLWLACALDGDPEQLQRAGIRLLTSGKLPKKLEAKCTTTY